MTDPDIGKIQRAEYGAPMPNKKRTRKNPYKLNRSTRDNGRLFRKIKFAGDVVTKYKLSTREAVTAFLLVRRTAYKRGGKCKMSYKTFSALQKGFDSHVSHVLAGLQKKGVLESYHYDNKGTGYCEASVAYKFVQDLAASTHYVRIDPFDFSYEARAELTLSDRIAYAVIRAVYDKYGSLAASSMAKFAGVTRQTMTSKLHKFDEMELITLKIDTSKDTFIDLPFKVKDICDKNIVRSNGYEGFRNEIRRCLWMYENASTRLEVDSKGVGVIIRTPINKYRKIIERGNEVLSIPCSCEGSVMRKATTWLKSNGPLSKRYALLRAKYDAVNEFTGNPDIKAVEVVRTHSTSFPEDCRKYVCAVCERFAGMHYIQNASVPDVVRKDEDGNWCFTAFSAVTSSDAENGYKMFDISDLL